MKKNTLLRFFNVTSILFILLCGYANHAFANQAIPQVSVQLWSVKDEVKADITSTLNAIRSMGFKGVEFAGEFGEFSDKPKDLKALLDKLNLKVSGAHVHFDKLNAQNFEKTVDFYQTLGCSKLIIPYDERAFDPKGVKEVVAQLNELSTKLAPFGMQVGFHNHWAEFNEFEKSTYWDYIAKSTNKDVILQLDVGWVTYAGKDPVEYVRRYPGRTVITHYKVKLPEGTLGKTPIIGQDTIDWANLIKANIRVGGTQWLVVEQEEYPNGLSPLEAVAMSKKGLDVYLNAL
ncbi:MAG: sugar phosphate isomerase/epimerase [Paraglaciecola sp.]|jgi:sugar phosphate isomerase/epimerase